MIRLVETPAKRLKAVILAGGKGTRLKDITGDVLPKPMVPVCGKPVLEYQIELLVKQGFTEILLLTGYLSESIEAYFGDGSRFGAQISYLVEKEPLGTSGAVLAAKEWIGNEHFLVLYGDLIFSMDLVRLQERHFQTQSDATLVVHPNDHPADSDLLKVNENDRVTEWLPKASRNPGFYANIVNAAVYVLSPKILNTIPKKGSSDFGTQVFPEVLKAGLKMSAYRTSEYLKDMGTIERLRKVESHMKKGLIERRNLTHLQRAIFLDRDGTLNVSDGYIRTVGQLKLETGVPEALQKIQYSDFLPICITNQPVIARGDIDEAALAIIHAKLEGMLGEKGAFLERIYYCPHHPDAGFEGERKELKIKCDCRKPETALLKKAAQDYHLDLSQSYMIGDQTADIELAKRAGLKGAVLLKTGEAGRDQKYTATPSFIAENLMSAIDWILARET